MSGFKKMLARNGTIEVAFGAMRLYRYALKNLFHIITNLQYPYHYPILPTRMI